MEKSNFLRIIEGPIVSWAKWADSIYPPPPYLKSTHPLLKNLPAHDLAIPNASPH